MRVYSARDPRKPMPVMFTMLQPGAVVLDLPRIAKIRYNAGWEAPNPSNISQKLMLTVEELTEAHRTIREGHDVAEVWIKDHAPTCSTHQMRGEYETPAMCDCDTFNKPEGFGIEIADAIMRLGDIAYANGLNLQQALDYKQAFNATRRHRHGGKQF
jgi:hypothetical protein